MASPRIVNMYDIGIRGPKKNATKSFITISARPVSIACVGYSQRLLNNPIMKYILASS